MLLGDWGGLPVWPYYSPAQVLVATAMGSIARNESTDFVLALGDNFYLVGVKNEFDKRFSVIFKKLFDFGYI